MGEKIGYIAALLFCVIMIISLCREVIEPSEYGFWAWRRESMHRFADKIHPVGTYIVCALVLAAIFAPIYSYFNPNTNAEAYIVFCAFILAALASIFFYIHKYLKSHIVRWAIPPIYEDVIESPDGSVLGFKDNHWESIKKKDKKRLFLRKNNIDISLNGLEELKKTLRYGKYGFVDKNGNEIIPFIFDVAQNFSEGLAAVKKDCKWGYIDQSGNELIPFMFSDAKMFGKGMAAVQKNGKWGYIRNIYTAKN